MERYRRSYGHVAERLEIICDHRYQVSAGNYSGKYGRRGSRHLYGGHRRTGTNRDAHGQSVERGEGLVIDSYLELD
jgi:hypothetical protein